MPAGHTEAFPGAAAALWRRLSQVASPAASPFLARRRATSLAKAVTNPPGIYGRCRCNAW